MLLKDAIISFVISEKGQFYHLALVVNSLSCLLPLIGASAEAPGRPPKKKSRAAKILCRCSLHSSLMVVSRSHSPRHTNFQLPCDSKDQGLRHTLWANPLPPQLHHDVGDLASSGKMIEKNNHTLTKNDVRRGWIFLYSSFILKAGKLTVFRPACHSFVLLARDQCHRNG